MVIDVLELSQRTTFIWTFCLDQHCQMYFVNHKDVFVFLLKMPITCCLFDDVDVFYSLFQADGSVRGGVCAFLGAVGRKRQSCGRNHM